MKFKSWKWWTAFYKTCLRNFINGRKKSDTKNISVLLDLRRRGYVLLTKAKGLVKDNCSVAYAFCDINCYLAIKFNDNTCKYFNSQNELRKLLVLQLPIFVLDWSEAELLLKQMFLKWTKSFRSYFLFGESSFHSYFFLCICVGSEFLYSNCFLDCFTYKLCLLFWR